METYGNRCKKFAAALRGNWHLRTIFDDKSFIIELVERGQTEVSFIIPLQVLEAWEGAKQEKELVSFEELAIGELNTHMA